MKELKIIEAKMKELLGVQELTFDENRGGFVLSDGEYIDTTMTTHSTVAGYFDYALDSLIMLGVVRMRMDSGTLSLEYVNITDKQKEVVLKFIKDNSEKIKCVFFERSYGALDLPKDAKKIFEILTPKKKLPKVKSEE